MCILWGWRPINDMEASKAMGEMMSDEASSHFMASSQI